MKKILLIWNLIMAGFVLADAQGAIKFSNFSTGYYVSTNGARVGLGSASGVTDIGLGDYYYELLYDTSTPTSSNPLTGGWEPTGLIATNSTIFAGGITGPGGAAGVAVPQVAPSASAYFEIVGWSASLNSFSLPQLLAQYNSGNWEGLGYFGVSSPTAGAITLGGLGTPATLPSALFGGVSGIQSGFVLDGIGATPEPGSVALAGLGGLALLALRRKK
jgi:hypothetical protein